MLAMSIFQEVKIGLSQKFSQGELDSMRSSIAHTIQLAPNNPFGYLVQSKIFLYTEEIDAARKAIDKAIVLNPAIKESHDQKNAFERAFGTPGQQKAALENAQKNIPGYEFK